MVWTADDLVAAVRVRAQMPDAAGDGAITDADILTLANEEIALRLVPLVRRSRGDYFVSTHDVDIVSGTASYRVPTRAQTSGLRELTIVDPSGREWPVPQMHLEDAGPAQIYGGGWDAVRFYMEGPNVVLVLDKSGSMVSDPNGFWDHDNDPGTAPVTRWSSLHTVVETLTTDFGDAINFGAHLFPSVNATAQYSFESCIVDANITVAVAASNKDAILAGIPAEDNVTLRGGTPIASGVIVAVDHLKTLDPLVPRAIVLVTDGAANCAAGAEAPELFEVYDENVHTVVGDAFTIDGIPTYVVGVGIADVVSSTEQDGNPDSTNTFSRLNELATDGGKPRSDPSQKFYNTINQIELAAALGEIAFDALTCIIPLESSQIAPGGTGVEVDGAPIPFVTDCSTQDGWMYTNPQGPFDAIRLCGSACGGLKLVGEASITVCQL